jgi:hypothetical protein
LPPTSGAVFTSKDYKKIWHAECFAAKNDGLKTSFVFAGVGSGEGCEGGSGSEKGNYFLHNKKKQ